MSSYYHCTPPPEPGSLLPRQHQGEVKVKVQPAKGSATSLGATGSLLPVRLPPRRSALADKPPVAPRLREARRQPVPTDFDFALARCPRDQDSIPFGEQSQRWAACLTRTPPWRTAWQERPAPVSCGWELGP